MDDDLKQKLREIFRQEKEERPFLAIDYDESTTIRMYRNTEVEKVPWTSPPVSVTDMTITGRTRFELYRPFMQRLYPMDFPVVNPSFDRTTLRRDQLMYSWPGHRFGHKSFAGNLDALFAAARRFVTDSVMLGVGRTLCIRGHGEQLGQGTPLPCTLCEPPRMPSPITAAALLNWSL